MEDVGSCHYAFESTMHKEVFVDMHSIMQKRKERMFLFIPSQFVYPRHTKMSVHECDKGDKLGKLLALDIAGICAQTATILQGHNTYKWLLSRRGEEAQVLLNLLQAVSKLHLNGLAESPRLFSVPRQFSPGCSAQEYLSSRALQIVQKILSLPRMPYPERRGGAW
jgi:hypothetical protein